MRKRSHVRWMAWWGRSPTGWAQPSLPIWHSSPRPSLPGSGRLPLVPRYYKVHPLKVRLRQTVRSQSHQVRPPITPASPLPTVQTRSSSPKVEIIFFESAQGFSIVLLHQFAEPLVLLQTAESAKGTDNNRPDLSLHRTRLCFLALRLNDFVPRVTFFLARV